MSEIPSGYKLAFEREYKGFKIVALWPEDHRDAKVTITRDGKPLRDFTYPAYKVFNLQAHFEDIVDGELENSDSGYRLAGSDSLGGCVMPSLTRDEANVVAANTFTSEEAGRIGLEGDEYVDIVFDAPPGPQPGRFVEVEDSSGKSMRFGEWVHRPDGYWALRLNCGDNTTEQARNREVAHEHEKQVKAADQIIEECMSTFKDEYAKYDEPLIGIMWGLKAVAALRGKSALVKPGKTR